MGLAQDCCIVSTVFTQFLFVAKVDVIMQQGNCKTGRLRGAAASTEWYGVTVLDVSDGRCLTGFFLSF
jgi:hypothetical protein